MSGPDHRLRLVTMNVQLMTNDAVINPDAVKARAEAIVDAFLRDRWPDVICFNEVLDENARRILEDGLTKDWPHVARKFGPTRTLGLGDKYMVIGSIIAGLKAGNPLLALPVDVAFAQIAALIEVPDDAGLMVFSRFPIATETFVSYDEYKDTDSLADKGVALVLIERSAGCAYNILATHMQASYDAEDEYRDIRAAQLKRIQGLIESDAVRDFATPRRAATVVCGDLNIQGAGPSRQEWRDVFANGTSVPFFTTDMCDAWERFIAPGQNGLNDKGITNRNYEKKWESRLDYVLLRDPSGPVPSPVERRRFAVQRMFLTHPGLSDHIGVAAEINLHSLHCCPAEARDMAGIRVGIYAQSMDDAGMCWLRFSGRGTWSFTDVGDTSFEVYLPDNMSRQLGMQYVTDLREIPQAEEAWKIREQPSLSPKASTFVVPVDSFLVRVFRRDDGQGIVRFGFYRHLGTSPADAIDVSPQSLPIGLDWAALSTVSVNPPMEFWFRNKVREAASRAPHRSRFELLNSTGGKIELRMVRRQDPSSSLGEEEIGIDGGSGALLTVLADRVGDESLLWQVRRTAVTQQDFLVRWFTALNFLVYDPAAPPVLSCVDETGLDVSGADEITLEMRPDTSGGPRVLLRRDDVDTGENITLPGPGDAAWSPTETGYLTGLEIRIEEDETVGDDEAISTVPPLPEASYRERFEVKLEPGSGDYRLNVLIAREPT